MIITSDMRDAANLLGLTLPTTENALKTHYKRKSREEHPDTSKHPKAAERFMAVKDAYDTLKKARCFDLDSEDVAITRTEQGDLLSDLGKGLGPTTNGRPCSSCESTGYTTWSERLAERCTDCHQTPDGRWEYTCRRCEGTGTFKVNGVSKGECYTCKGTGWRKPKNQKRTQNRVWGFGTFVNVCKKCDGTSYVHIKVTKTHYNTCRECKGTGEIRIFNPVLPKGFLT